MRRMMTLAVVLVLTALCGCHNIDDSPSRKFDKGERAKHAITEREGVVLGNYLSDSSEKFVLIQHAANEDEKRNAQIERAGVVEAYYRESELISLNTQVVSQEVPQPKPEMEPEKVIEPREVGAGSKPEPKPVQAVVAVAQVDQPDPKFGANQEVRSKRGWKVGTVVAKSWDVQYGCWSYVVRIEDNLPLVRYYEPELEIRPTY